MIRRISISRHVKPDDVIWRGRPSGISNIAVYAYCVIVFIAVIYCAVRFEKILFSLLGLYPVGRCCVTLNKARKTEYILTEYEISLRSSAYTLSGYGVPVSEIIGVSIRQNPLVRIFGIGNLYIHSRHGNCDLTLSGVKNPSKVRELILKTANLS